MTTLAHPRGGLRPADLDFHPGLQIHAIQAPRVDRRLSLLISLLCYESLAAGVFLAVRHRDAIVEHIRTTQTVILDPVMARLDPGPLKPLLPPAPTPGPRLPAVADQPLAPPRPDQVPDTTPTTLPTDQGHTMLRPGTGDTVPGVDPNASPGTTSNGYGRGEPIEITVSQVKVLHSVTPVYPNLARLTRRQGDVVLRLTIDPQGAVSEVHVVSGPEVFHAEALRAARAWRFTPARVGGEAVPAVFNLTLQFVMR
jgi:TonB family protein